MTKKFKPNKSQLHTLLKTSIVTGFFGGIIWPVFWLVAYGFNMVNINITVFWDDFFWGNLPFEKWYMYIVAIGLYSLLSVLFAVIYYMLFKKFSHWLMGLIYGVFIWAVFLFGIPLLVKRQMDFTNYSEETVVGLLCLGILYGLFIGYTISFNYKILRIDRRNDV